MQLINVIQAALLVASQASASPIGGSETLAPNAVNDLTERATVLPVSCGPTSNQRAWPLQSVEDAYNTLVTMATAGNTVIGGRRSYPGKYGRGPTDTPSDASVVSALNAIPGCQTEQAGKQYWEFPITDPVFSGGPAGSQGADRVVAIADTTTPPGSFLYCLAMTHRGVSNNAFQPCT